jgi:hypothetical protein
MQKQKKNTTLLCTFRNCKNIQTDNEFCTKHQAKKGRKDLVDALTQLSDWADNFTNIVPSPTIKKEQEKMYNLLMDFIIYS